MLISYDVQKINKVLHDFYNATGVRINLYSETFTPISCRQNEMCKYCQYIQKDTTCKKACVAFDDALLQKSLKSMKAERDVCPFGLMNIAVPIYSGNSAIGFLFFGHIKMNPQYSESKYSKESSYHDKEKLKEYYGVLSLFNLEQIQSVTNLAQILVSHLLTENMLKIDSGEILQKAIAYINENLEKDLSIKQISKNINVSKSVLYSKFHSRFSCTIGEYINKKRIEKSIELLTKTNLSIEEVSQKCGFSSASYYTKIFKQQMGITPLKFKKSQTI